MYPYLIMHTGHQILGRKKSGVGPSGSWSEKTWIRSSLFGAVSLELCEIRTYYWMELVELHPEQQWNNSLNESVVEILLENPLCRGYSGSFQ